MIDRKKIDEIILTDGGDNWWKPELFEQNTQSLIPKELEILSTPPKAEENYNCFIHALGFSDDKEFVKSCSGFIYDPFFQKLIDEGELIYTEDPQNGDYVIYKDMKKYPKMITHIGVLDDGKIISKWAWGPLFRHELFDVPKSYGDKVLYLKNISENKARELFEKYSEFNVKPPSD